MILMFVLSVILLTWKATPAAAGKMDDLQAQLLSANGEQRIKILEDIYIESQETEDVSSQLKHLNNLISEAKTQKNDLEEVNALAERASLFYNYDMNDSVLIVVRRDMERVKEVEQWQVYYEMWGLIANTYVFMGQNNMGIHETQAMFEDARKRGDKLGMGQANCIMGTAYSNLRNFDQSVEVFEKSLAELSELDPVPSVMPDVYVYYGNALNDMKDYAKLDQLTVKWKGFLKKFFSEHHLDNTSTGDMYLSYYYLACTQAALGLGRLEDAAQQLAEARNHIANMDNQLGGKWLYYSAQLMNQEGHYALALDENTRRMQLSDMSDKAMEAMVKLQRAEILEKMGYHVEAGKLYKELYFINDSLNAQETKGQLNEMNTIFQVGEKELENIRLQQENERAQFRFIIIVISLIVISFAIFVFFRLRAARKLKQAHEQLQVAYSDLQKTNEDLNKANRVIEETTAAKERIESELRIARDIQMSMVPNTFPEDEGLDLYASMTPAKAVGGDLYDYVLLENKLYFALGDVSGKGVPASLFMAQATRLFRTLAKQNLLPADICTRMNSELAEDNEQGMFVTMFIGLVDLQSGHLDFSNAGHNPPVINNDHFLEMEPNAPIGLWPGLEYVGEEIANIHNTPIFVYTDGLNEAENAAQEQFGDDHLLQILRETPYQSARQMIELLQEEVARHVAGADPSDDLTMLCLKIN